MGSISLENKTINCLIAATLYFAAPVPELAPRTKLEFAFFLFSMGADSSNGSYWFLGLLICWFLGVSFRGLWVSWFLSFSVSRFLFFRWMFFTLGSKFSEMFQIPMSWFLIDIDFIQTDVMDFRCPSFPTSTTCSISNFWDLKTYYFWKRPKDFLDSFQVSWCLPKSK